MTVTAIVGAQWGDEGKGKLTDLLAQEADLVIRYGGGSNAGHTVLNEHGHFKLHLIPSGIFNPGAVSLIGTGTVVDLDKLPAEIEQLRQAKVPVEGLKISGRAHLVMPYHLLLDGLSDEARGRLTLSTTRQGVGPAYVDKADRVGLQVDDLLHPDVVRQRLSLVLPQKNRLLHDVFGHATLDEAALLEKTECWAREFGGMIVDQVPIVTSALEAKENILLEGQLGALRDLDWGTYPYVTSSTTLAGGAAVGGGVPATRIDRVVGVVKAYTTAVGTGPVPTELREEEGEHLRSIGGEFGTTTGRPRRVGWFDGVAVRFACLLNGFDSLAVTKLDVLDGMPSLRICTAYRVDGNTYNTIPSTTLMEQAEPVYEDLPGWEEDTSRARTWKDLPGQAKAYLLRIEELVGAPITIVSVGRRREQTLYRKQG